MYSELSDNELLELINEQKDNDAMETLIKRYGPMITGQSRSLYIIGADEEDLIQEGMIGLVKAVNNYRPDKGATFKTFAFIVREKAAHYRGEQFKQQEKRTVELLYIDLWRWRGRLLQPA